jgi:tetratricopeptide (TPR) repeat protein
VRRWSLPGAGGEPLREAVELAQSLDRAARADAPDGSGAEGGLAESLLRRWLESGVEDVEGRVWALSLLAQISEEAGNFREATLLKREAAELAPPDEARRLLFDVAKLASGPLDDLRLAAGIYEELHERDATDPDAWKPLVDVYRRLDDFTRLADLLAEVTGYVDDPQERSKLRLERVKVGMDKLRLSDDDAARELRDIVDEDPTAANAAILLGTLLERSGREDDLAELLAKQLDAA